jgi:hypothetical protein
MSSSADIPHQVIVDAFGPFVTGVMLQQMFLGVFCVQVYDYWVRHSLENRMNSI